MSNKVRFVDNLKVGAYKTISTEDNINISNNIDNYVLTATGDPNNINGEAQLIFSGSKLGIGDNPNPQAKLDIKGKFQEDLLLVKNFYNQGVEVDNEGIFKLIEFEILPTPQEGGIVYSQDNFFIGI